MWISMTKTKPEQGAKVWYYFEITGVSSGEYESNEHGDTFFGEGGFLTNDVTHWMPLRWSKERPEKPNEN